MDTENHLIIPTLPETEEETLYDLEQKFAERFGCSYSPDAYSLSDEALTVVLRRSLEDDRDYLRGFIIAEIPKEQVLIDVAGDRDAEITALLGEAYETFSMEYWNPYYRYPVLNLICVLLQNCTGDRAALYQKIMELMTHMDMYELIELSRPNVYEPEELLELKRLRKTVLECAYRKYKGEEAALDFTDIDRQLADIDRALEVTAYPYRNRDDLMLENDYLRKEIEVDKAYLMAEDAAEPELSDGLLDEINDVSGSIKKQVDAMIKEAAQERSAPETD